jgi:hypothetical protein
VAGPGGRFRVVTFSKAIGGDYWQYSLGPTRVLAVLKLYSDDEDVLVPESSDRAGLVLSHNALVWRKYWTTLGDEDLEFWTAPTEAPLPTID